MQKMLRTYIYFTFAIWALLGAPIIPAHAQTTQSALQRAIVEKEQEILKLQGELRTLREELARMDTAPSTTQSGQSGASQSFGSFSHNLSQGSSGADVERMQRALHALGHYPEAIFSGYYGGLSEEAVKRFQRARNIVSSGSPQTTGYGALGPRTRAELSSASGSPSTSSSSVGSGSQSSGSSSTSGISTGVWGSSSTRVEESSGPVSPYDKMVTLNRGGARNDKVEEEYVRIEVGSRASGPVTVSGWKLKSTVTNQEITIGEVAQLFQFGRTNPKGAITLSPRDRLIINTGTSLIGQDSFRANMCSGYLNQFYRFNPSMSTGSSCPRPQDELISRSTIPLTDSCHDYIRRLSSCSVPDFTRFPVDLTPRCRTFLQGELNYNACVSAHLKNANFWGSEWRLYLGRSEPLWRTTRETVELIDEFGNVVDSFSY